MFVLLVIVALYPIIYVTLFSSVSIPESPPILEMLADSIYHLSQLFSDVTSYYDDVLSLVYCGRNLGSDCISPWLLPSSISFRII